MWCYRPCERMLPCGWALSFCSYYSGTTSMTIVKLQNKINECMRHISHVYTCATLVTRSMRRWKLCWRSVFVCQPTTGNLAPSAPCPTRSGQRPVSFACTAYSDLSPLHTQCYRLRSLLVQTQPETIQKLCDFFALINIRDLS
jgi:hypothetical protein